MKTDQREASLRPGLLVRAEATVGLVTAVVAYNVWFPHRWGWFWLLLLTPDVSLLPFAMGKGALRFAAGFYNAWHSLVGPLVLLGWAWHADWSAGSAYALIWLAHIALDRMLGYGLKYAGSFQWTHIQAVQAGAEGGAGRVA